MCFIVDAGLSKDRLFNYKAFGAYALDYEAAHYVYSGNKFPSLLTDDVLVTSNVGSHTYTQPKKKKCLPQEILYPFIVFLLCLKTNS